jgi:hypothetical protein
MSKIARAGFLAAMLFNAGGLSAAELHLRCSPMAEPAMQGDERDFRVDFRQDGTVRLLASGNGVLPEEATAGLPLSSSYLSDKDIIATAVWGDESIGLSLLFFGSGIWRGTLRFGRTVVLPELSFPAGAEYDLNCSEVGA